MDAKTSALRMLRDEHASMDAVISAFCIVTENIANEKLAADFELLWSIICYIEEYPEQKHHPKEESVLFPLLRGQQDELSSQHKNGGPHLLHIKTVIGRLEAGIPGAAIELAQRVKDYDYFHKKNMQLEDGVVLPKAAKLLTLEFYPRIVYLVPEPWGLGPRLPS